MLICTQVMDTFYPTFLWSDYVTKGAVPRRGWY